MWSNALLSAMQILMSVNVAYVHIYTPAFMILNRNAYC